MRRAALALCVVVLLVGFTATAAASHRSVCETYRASSVPILHPAVDVGTLQVCDTTGDKVVDSVRFDPDAPADGEVNLGLDLSDRTDRRDVNAGSEARTTLHLPTNPIIHNEIYLDDRGEDLGDKQVGTRGGLYTDRGLVFLWAQLSDNDGDGRPDTYILLTCAPELGCVAPNPGMIPGAPQRVDLPDAGVDTPVGPIP